MPSSDADFYAVLGIDPRADPATIRTAWAAEQRLWGVRQNAPDLETRHAAERHVEMLGELKDTLLDPRRRAIYDRERSRLPLKPLSLGEAARSAGEGSSAGVPARKDPSPPPSPSGRGSVQHNQILKPLGIGLTGAVISGGQIFHWDFAVMMAIVFLLSLPVYAFDVLGLRSGAWVFRTRTRALASWIVLVALTLGFGLTVILHV